jgi:hypothetical protein
MSPENETYTWPLAIMAILVLLGLVALTLLYNRKRRLQNSVEEQFKDFRDKAVALMDQLDGLRRRHETLPSTDPDFTEPMAGATLALYNAVEADLNSLWERWLKIMELWDRAQKLVRSGSVLAVGQAEEARRLLNLGDIDELLRQSGSCKDRLDRLNEGHEQAREALVSGRGQLAELRKSIDQGTGILLPSDSHGQQIVRAESTLARAEGMLAADPIGAEDLITRVRRSLTNLDRQPGREPDRSRRPRPSYSVLDELAAAADGFRTAAAKLRLTNLLGLFARFWMIVWGLSLLFGLLNFFLPLVIFVAGVVIVFAGFWAILQTITLWLWYGFWRVGR